MSSIAAFTARRAFAARPALARAPIRRYATTPGAKAEESGLDKAPKRDPELYVCSFFRG
jgi:hypothetical protein